MVGPARPRIVLFGSSIVQFSYSNSGWGAALADIYARKADVVLRGYSGWNTRMALQVLDSVFPKDAPLQPALVILYFGGNDSMGPHPSGLGPHVPLPEYVENMRKIALHVQSLSDKTRLIVLSTPPVNEELLNSTWLRGDRTNELCGKYSEACIELCKEMGLKYVDLFTAIQQKENWKSVCFFDGIHFAAEGSKIVLDEIMKVIKEADWEPSMHWKCMPTEFDDDSPFYIVAGDGKSTLNCTELIIQRNFHLD